MIAILDHDLRLITPTDPACSTGEVSSASTGSERCYQLTHDYLVHSLRDWLTRKQRETRRGRAELRLADRTALWSARPENRRLPSVLEWANIRLLTKKSDWSQPQERMMRRAGRVHGLRGLSLAILMALASWGGIEGYGALRASALSRVAQDRQHHRRPGSHQGAAAISPMGGSSTRRAVVEYAQGQRSASSSQLNPSRLVAR